MTDKKIICITGAAGFIGFHTAKKLILLGHRVVGIDNFNDYYDVDIKHTRIKELEKLQTTLPNSFVLYSGDICDLPLLQDIFNKHRINQICHLAAQAGVRYSLKNPRKYIESNISGFLNILEISNSFNLKNLVYASSSSVYGSSKHQVLSETDQTNKPLSMYASSKIMNELMAYSFYHLYGINSIGMRFFTVYGEFDRPDMAISIFSKCIRSGNKIYLNNGGNMVRCYTHISDIVNGVISALDQQNIGCETINMGGSEEITMSDLLHTLEIGYDKKAVVEMVEMPLGEVLSTNSDNTKAEKLLGWKPTISFETGIREYIQWFKSE